MGFQRRVQSRLERLGEPGLSIIAIVAAFSAYFAMYAFRKPFAAAAYEHHTLWGLGLKDALVISQVIGYALSKFIGIRFLSELAREHRAKALLLLVLFAELALVGFGAVPPKWRFIMIFLNGLPLGAVWGLVFGFLEGRRTSELLGAGLSVSYIVASGFVKSAGLEVKGWVGEAWMPATTGALFLPVFVLMVWVLSVLPHPNAEDEQARVARTPMRKRDRRAFLRRHWFAMGLLCLLYLALTAFRDFRDNYAADIWRELGEADASRALTTTEMWVAFVVMAVLAALYRIKNNHTALLAVHLIMAVGGALLAASTALFMQGLLSPYAWMVGIGMGLYLCYVPFGCMLFDRMIAATGTAGTSVFMIYVADAVGYAGSVGLVLYKHFGHADMHKTTFVTWVGLFVGALCVVGFLISATQFWRLRQTV